MFLGLFAIAGTPPFSVFSSELNVIISVFHGKLYALGFLLIMLLALIFAGVALALFRIFYPGDRKSDVKAGELNISGTLVILLLLLVISVTGLYIPGSVRQLINDAQNIITGG
jgi:hydrogenase-4 component F